MSLFLGIGLGPIQTGIFLSGASKGGFEHIVIAEVDNKLKDAVKASGGIISVNIAKDSAVYTETYANVEVYNPLDADDLKKLIEAAADADELATALPSVNFFPQIAAWLKQGFAMQPQRRRFIYTAENNNHAAEELEKAIGQHFDATYYLNTVVGKMSGVANAVDCDKQGLKLLCPGADRGHLVEEFNKILISSAPGIEQRQVKNLLVKPELYPFEEAKLYGHNAIHFLLGILGRQQGLEYMSELRGSPELMKKAETAFIFEAGAALCKKWAGLDDIFTEKGFSAYAQDLLVRMTNPFLKDAINRITRDIPRKLSWDDRITGTMRLVLAQGGEPLILAEGAALAAAELYGDASESIRNGLVNLWPSPWTGEHEKLIQAILAKVKR
jgi:mannitol-1-phosphate 5-dehydrogenase